MTIDLRCYLLLRGQTWHFRKAVPARLQAAFGIREFTWSLRTDSLREAQRLALHSLVFVDDLLARHATADAHDSADIARRQLANFKIQLTSSSPRAIAHVATPTATAQSNSPLVRTNITKSTGDSDSPLILAAWSEYEAEKRPRWRSKTSDEYRSTVEEFASPDFVGNKPIAAVSRADVIAYRDTLSKLPAQRGKSKRYRSLDVSALLKLKIPSAERMSDKTINDRLALLSAFFHWCKTVRRYDCQDAFFQVRLDRQASDERAAFTDDDLRKIFGSKLFTAKAFRKPSQYWIPLLGYYTGARITELAQLHVDDLVVVDGIHCIRIKDDGESQRLKTANASRLVPIHPALVELGLLDHAATARRQDTRLFPDIRYIGKSLGAEPSKWFTKYRRSVGIPDTDEAGRQKVFHSFRKTFVTRLRQAGVDVSLIQQLVGHARTAHGVTEIYTEGFAVPDCHRAIAELPAGPAPILTFGSPPR